MNESFWEKVKKGLKISAEKTKEFAEIANLKGAILILENKKGKPLELIEAFFDLNLNLAREYASNIFTIVREMSFAPIQTRERLTFSFSRLIEEKLREFITTLKGSCDESDITILLGTVINFWVRFIFGEKVPTTDELSKRVWFGLSYKLT